MNKFKLEKLSKKIVELENKALKMMGVYGLSSKSTGVNKKMSSEIMKVKKEKKKIYKAVCRNPLTTDYFSDEVFKKKGNLLVVLKFINKQLLLHQWNKLFECDIKMVIQKENK